MTKQEARELVASLTPDEKDLLRRLAGAVQCAYQETRIHDVLGGPPSLQETAALRGLVRKGLINVNMHGLTEPTVQ